MHQLAIRSALAAMAIAAAALGTPIIANAAPAGPCEEVTFVGVCEPSNHQQTRSPSQQGMGEVIVPGIGNNPVTVG
jgi:hypothetical protein